MNGHLHSAVVARLERVGRACGPAVDSHADEPRVYRSIQLGPRQEVAKAVSAVDEGSRGLPCDCVLRQLQRRMLSFGREGVH